MAYLELKLERDGFNQPWGLRMLGGVDVGAPLTISRVIAGTASEGVLRVGDIITSVRGQDVTSFTHQDTTELFKSAGNTITLTVARGLVNGETPASTPGTTTMDAPFGGSNPPSRKTSQVGKPPARKFSDRRLEYLIPKSCKGFQTMQSPTAFLPSTAFGQKPKSPMELQVEESYREQHHEHGMIVDQPYRSTPLISPGPKVKRDTPIVASYLNMHPDPQVRGAAPHITQVSGLNTMLNSANEQLARKVATQVKTVAGARPTSDRVDTGRSPKIIHHQFNTPAGLYSSENMASSLHQQTGIAPSMSGPRREFNLQNSETLKMIMEEDSQKPAVQQKPKSHVVYDVHEAKVYRPHRF